jgi:hypothetical protein
MVKWKELGKKVTTAYFKIVFLYPPESNEKIYKTT